MAKGMVRERLNIYYLLDTSGTMAGARIQQLNTCMQELKPALEEVGIDNNVEIVVRVIEFGNGETAQWVVGNETHGVSIENFLWTNLRAEGLSKPTAQAIKLLADAIEPEYLGTRILRPVIILVTDGSCTDGEFQYNAACNILANKFRGRTVRIAVGIEDANVVELGKFASRERVNGEYRSAVLDADTAEMMSQLIDWCGIYYWYEDEDIIDDRSSVSQSCSINGNELNVLELHDPTWI